jgi:hypothetical protein
MPKELIYKITAPSLEDMLSGEFYHQLFHTDQILSVDPHKSSAGYARRHCRDILKPQYSNWRGFNWDQSLLFAKANGWTSNIHRDSQIDCETPWAINWIRGGSGTMSFWTKEQLGPGITTVDNRGAPNITWHTDQAAYRSYTMDPGCYLVNADFPHRAQGHGVRYAVSIRSTGDFHRPWSEIVDCFSSLF